MLPPLLLAQSVDDCLACHGDQSLTTERKGKTVSLFVERTTLQKSPHAKLVCVACHAGFDPQNVPHKEKIEPVNCLTCHRNAPTKHPFHAAMLSKQSNDAALTAMCKQCHGTHNIVSPKSPDSKHTYLLQTCGKCHEEQKANFLNSVHGKASAAGISSAPNCISCHQNHITGLTESQDSVAVKTAQVKLCLSCHLDNPDVRARVAPSSKFISSYEHSVHGAALTNGKAAAANCVDCHGSHDIQQGNQSTSQVNRQNIPLTCAKCHSAIQKEYAESIHGKSAAQGNNEAPVCTNCHGEHNILATSNPDSRVAAQNVSQQVCSPCHSSVTLSEKYGMAGNRFQTYSVSYHGLATRSGNVQVANCASCHGAHNIKPSSDSTSSVNKANLIKTCGKCHPGANERFAVGSVHVTTIQKENPVMYWISFFYIALIATVIGGMFLHNGIDFYRKSKRTLMIRRGLITEEHYGHSLYVRMTLSERIQHVSLMLSFFALVFTGFMLRYPDAFWVTAIRSLSEHAFTVRSVVHRIAAVVMVSASLYHLYYILFTPRGKQLFRDLMPKLNDVSDAISVLQYNFGFSQVKPQFERFSYIEKSEYWAMIWGTIVMAITGSILWFDNTFMGLLTKDGWDVAHVIHFYEAWLAFLAILIWHIYYVIFNPDIYPMNLAWLKGTITEKEMAEEHPLELNALKRQKLEDDAMIVIDANDTQQNLKPVVEKQQMNVDSETGEDKS
jgi:formate dehydrogenase gamma subunit